MELHVQQRKLPIIAATSGATCTTRASQQQQVLATAAAATPSNIRIDPDFFIPEKTMIKWKRTR